MLRAFSAKRYRHLGADDLRFSRINILIGPNNSGKSTLIEALQFARELIVPDLAAGVSGSAFERALARRGRGELLDRSVPHPGEIELSWTLGSPSYPDITYDIAFAVGVSEDFPGAFYLSRERLRYAQPAAGKDRPFEFINCHETRRGRGSFSIKDGEQKPRSLQLDVDEHDTVFRQMKALLRDSRFYSEIYPQFVSVSDAASAQFVGVRAYASADLVPARIIEGAPRDLSVRTLDPAGVQLVNVLRAIDQGPGLEEYTRTLQDVLPGLQRVKIVDVSDEKQQVVLETRGGRFKLKEMSDGTIKAAVLALLMTTPERCTLLTLDEPELNLHPAWLKVLGTWLSRCRSAEQLIVSTHSPDLLDRLTEPFRAGEAALFVCPWPGKGIRRVEPGELDELFKRGWELGDLYRVGEPRLGGWPW